MQELQTVYKKLLAYHKDAPNVDFDGKVSYKQTRFKYATLGNIIDKIRPILLNHGLAFYQSIEDESVITVIFDESSSIRSTKKLPQISNPQDLGKWLTYIKRYQLAAMLGIVADEDNDGQIPESKETQKQKDDRVEKQTLLDFISKCNSVPKLVELENRMENQGKLTDVYMALIENRKAALIDKKMAK